MHFYTNCSPQSNLQTPKRTHPAISRDLSNASPPIIKNTSIVKRDPSAKSDRLNRRTCYPTQLQGIRLPPIGHGPTSKTRDWNPEFQYQRPNVVFNAFVDIVYPRWPHAHEQLRLSDFAIDCPTSTSLSFTSSQPLTSSSSSSSSPSSGSRLPQKIHPSNQTQPPKPLLQTRSADGNWLRLDSISLARLHHQLQLISRSFDPSSDTIWWNPRPSQTNNDMYTIQNANSNSTNRTSSNPAPRHSIHSKQGPFAVTNPRDLTWAIYRSFDAPWQQWRGRRTSAALPCSGENPRVPHFSIIIRGKNDADDGVGGVDDDDDDDVHAGVNVQPGETWRETGADPDMDVEMEGVEERIENRLTGDELAMVLRAIIREPVPDRR